MLIRGSRQQRGAVDEAVSVITDLYAYCEQGATDSYSPSERSTLAESLNKLRDAYYAGRAMLNIPEDISFQVI